MAFLLPVQLGDFSVFMSADHESVLLLTDFFWSTDVLLTLQVEKYVTCCEDLAWRVANAQLLF
jgi:hypothetical protein